MAKNKMIQGPEPGEGARSDAPAELDGALRLELEGMRFCGALHGKSLETGLPVFQPDDDRFRHTLVIGRTGSGKSNHIQQLERADIRAGVGLAIIAAHEEDAIYPLACVPEERMDDVVLVDASNRRYLPCMNPLDVDRRDPAAVSKAVDDAIALLKTDCHHQWTGPRFEQLARNGLLLMLDPRFPDPPHLALLERIYNDPNYVWSCLERCGNPDLQLQWSNEASAHRSSDHGDMVQWFLSKVRRISGDEVLRHVFGPGRATIDIAEVVEQGKILVVALPEARIGRTAARIIGAWVVARLRDAILQRANALLDPAGPSGDLGIFGLQPGGLDGLDPFYVYIDEFARFATPEFVPLLAESRKYHVGFTLALQTLSQADIYDPRTDGRAGLVQAILGNVGSVICYPVGSMDAVDIARQIDVSPFDTMHIERYRPLARLCIDNRPMEAQQLVVPEKPAPDRPSTPRRIARRHITRRVWLPVASRAA